MIYAADYRKVGAWLICAVELQERNGRGAEQIMWTRRKPSAGLVVPPAASFSLVASLAREGWVAPMRSRPRRLTTGNVPDGYIVNGLARQVRILPTRPSNTTWPGGPSKVFNPK